MRLKDVAILNPKYDGEDLDNELVSFSPMECLRYDNLRPYTIPFKDASNIVLNKYEEIKKGSSH